MGGSIRFAGIAACALIGISPDPSQAQVNVTTYHNDNARTGQNMHETVLTPLNINSTQFGKLFTVTVDGFVYAAPLYLANQFDSPGWQHREQHRGFKVRRSDSRIGNHGDAGDRSEYWHVVCRRDVRRKRYRCAISACH